MRNQERTMVEQERQRHLSHISTLWQDLLAAHSGGPEAASAAQQRLIQRYAPAALNYLRGALRDADAADELFQEFALRFVRGDFKRVQPERGRFRDYLKTVLMHLVS